ncbi:MAG: PEP-CTERM sorting domain-containing protein, partial [Opitutales bacterium]|nr:PEP-CTERM sorting domain-containing protein [Opitutales bacterium]
GGAGFISSGTGALNIGQDAQMDFDNAAASNRTLSLGGTTDIAVENIFNPIKFDPAEINNLFTKLVKQDVNKWIVKGAGAGFVDNASTELNVEGGELDFTTGALGSSVHAAHINVGTATLGWYAGNTEDLSGRIYLNNTAAAAFNIPSGTVTLLNSFNGTNGGLATTASLTKYGTGTLELGAANNFSGGLTVSTGTVKASFAGSVGSGAVSVSNNATLVVNALLANKINVTLGGTLAGNGLGTNTDDGVTIEDGGILSPNGDTLGTLSFSKLTLNGGSKVKWQLQNAADTAVAGVGYDTLVVTTLNLSNAISTKKKIIVEVTSAGPASGFVKTKLNKFEFANITIDLANGFNVTNLFSIDASQFEIDNNLTNDHLVWSMQYAADRDMMYVTTMIPEPSTYGLGLGALALAAVAIRRRKQKKSVA